MKKPGGFAYYLFGNHLENIGIRHIIENSEEFMKINLTKLLESPKAKFVNQDLNSTAYNFIEYFDVTSSDRVYSFELENEQFNLGCK